MLIQVTGNSEINSRQGNWQQVGSLITVPLVMSSVGRISFQVLRNSNVEILIVTTAGGTATKIIGKGIVGIKTDIYQSLHDNIM